MPDEREIIPVDVEKPKLFFLEKYNCPVCEREREVRVPITEIREHHKKIEYGELLQYTPIVYFDTHKSCTGGEEHSIVLYFNKNTNIESIKPAFIVKKGGKTGQPKIIEYLCPLCYEEDQSFIEEKYNELVYLKCINEIKKGGKNPTPENMRELSKKEQKNYENFLHLFGRIVELYPDEIKQIEDHYKKMKKEDTPGIFIESIDKHRGKKSRKIHKICLEIGPELNIWQKDEIHLIEGNE